MGKSQRDKGQRGERKTVQELREAGFLEAHRDINDVWAGRGVDLIGTEPFLIQVKNRKKYVPVNTIEQMVWGWPHIPIVVTRAARQDPVGVIYWKHLLDLMTAYMRVTDLRGESWGEK